MSDKSNAKTAVLFPHMPLTSQHSQLSSWMCSHRVSLAPRLPVFIPNAGSLSGVWCGFGVTEVHTHIQTLLFITRQIITRTKEQNKSRPRAFFAVDPLFVILKYCICSNFASLLHQLFPYSLFSQIKDVHVAGCYLFWALFLQRWCFPWWCLFFIRLFTHFYCLVVGTLVIDQQNCHS